MRHVRQTFPRLCDQRAPSLVKLLEPRAQAFASRRARSERSEEIHCNGRSCDSLMILGAGLGAFRRSIGCRDEFRKIERAEQVVPAVENSDMRAIELVGGAAKEVAIPIAHIDQLMWSEVHGVDKDFRA